MAIHYVYEPQFSYAGWFDDSGRTNASWFDRDLIELDASGVPGEPDHPKTLNFFQMPFYDDPDLYFVTPPITVVVFPGLFLDPDLIFSPVSMRPLFPSDDMLKNEVVRIR